MADIGEEPACFIFKTKVKSAPNGRLEEDEDNIASLSHRKALYNKLWSRLEGILNDGIDAAHSKTLHEIKAFVSSASASAYGGKIPSALIVTGPNASSRLFEKFHSQLFEDSKIIYISIAPTESSNLKSLIRNVISKAIQHRDAEGQEENLIAAANGPRLLNYDLGILQELCARNNIHRVVIDLQNSEAFNVAVLADFLILLHSWIDRLPIVLLFGIATSVNEFQDQLPTAVMGCLQGEAYDVAKADEIIEWVFETAIADGELHFGPAFGDFMLQRARDNAQNTENVMQTIKYAYMCHFFGNATSIFLDGNLRFEDANLEVFHAVRNFHSFQILAEELLESGETDEVRNLLESNEALFHLLPTYIAKMHDKVTWMMGALRIWTTLSNWISLRSHSSLSALYVKTLVGGVALTSLLDELLLSIKKMPSDKLSDALRLVYDTLMSMPAADNDVSPDDYGDIQDELSNLLSARDLALGPLRSQATALGEASNFANRPGGGRQKKQDSKKELAYTELVSRFHDLLQNYFQKCLVPMKNQFPYEIVYYDTRALHQNALTPRPRFSIERALSSPHDYLGCNCCAQSTEGIVSAQPCTAILYQLYLESGALINVSDLYSAFTEILKAQHDDEHTIMAHFFRSLATLRYLGMLKSSRKRIDHLGKTMWKGL